MILVGTYSIEVWADEDGDLCGTVNGHDVQGRDLQGLMNAIRVEIRRQDRDEREP